MVRLRRQIAKNDEERQALEEELAHLEQLEQVGESAPSSEPTAKRARVEP